jgi:acetylornithine deacetylase
MEKRAMKPVEKILLDLVAIPTVSVQSNEPLIAYAETFFAPNVWTLRRYPYRDSAGTLKVNLVARTRRPPRARPALALVCHTDTVPYEASWREAVKPVLRRGRAYGRGSCDVKGFLACILATVAALDAATLAAPLEAVLTAEEEIGCVGAKHLAAAKAVRAPRLIVGEPTGLTPVYAGKGYGLAEIVVRGREAHSAFPGAGRSAIFDAARVLASIERAAKRLKRPRHKAFDPPHATINVGLIHGGTAKNIIPGECRITVEWRPVPGEPPDRALRLIEEELTRLRRRVPALEARIQPLRLDPPFEPGKQTGLRDLLSRLSGHTPSTVSFGTEAAHLRPDQGEAVVFGPGDMTTAHRTGEFVPVAQLRACVRHLQAAVAQFCKG